jgi:hypothetical protein
MIIDQESIVFLESQKDEQDVVFLYEKYEKEKEKEIPNLASIAITDMCNPSSFTVYYPDPNQKVFLELPRPGNIVRSNVIIHKNKKVKRE